jgi:hypothetical protein
MLFAWRGYQQGYPFLLATEMDEAEKFDDLVFQREIGGQLVYQVLQAKHKQEESKRIKVNDLLDEKDGEFSLPKYFRSYRKMGQNPTFKDGSIKDFIICTNINFDFKQLKKRKIEVKALEESDDILNVKSQEKPTACYQFIFDNLDEQGPLCKALRKTSDLHLLAKTLAEHLVNNRLLDLRDPFFKIYHLALTNEVIDIKNEKFYDHFINNDQGLLEPVKSFREELLNNLREELLNSLKQSKKRKRDVKAIDVKAELSRSLRLSSTFGKIDFKLENVPEFAKRIADILSENREEKARVIVIGKDEKEIVKKNIPKLVKYILIEKEGKLQFHPELIKGSFLPDDSNLDYFREQLKEKLTKRGVNDWSKLSQYRFDIEHFPKLNLIDDYVTDEEIKAFLEHLVFAINQPNEIELGKRIQEEMKEKFNKMASGLIADSFLRKMLDWMKEKKGRFLSHKEGKDFFDTAKRTLDELTRPPAGHLPEQWQVPPQNNNFVGRKKLLKQVADHFNQRDKPKVVLTACHGLGGIGKTQVALEFVWQHYKIYKGVVWFNAESKQRLQEDYIHLGKELRILREEERISAEEQAHCVKHWLEEPSHAGWLLIYDNAPKYGGEEGIGELFPTKEGKLLITSRYTEGWPQDSIAVDVFTLAESREYIQKILSIQLSESDKAQIDQLAETLGHLPLALAQACAYIKKNELRVTRYLELFEPRKKYLLADKALSEETLPQDTHRAIVYITWDITMDKIRDESPLATN